MSQNTPKTGLAQRMREWMRTRKRAFNATQMCDEFGLHGKAREQAVKAFRDFARRGEVSREPEQQNRRQNFYRYNQGWQRKSAKDGDLKRKILKAMYVSGTFTVTDIRRLSEVPSRNFIDKLVRRFMKTDLLKVVGRRPCAHGIGVENLYHITDRMRFRIEVME